MASSEANLELHCGPALFLAQPLPRSSDFMLDCYITIMVMPIIIIIAWQ